MHITLVIQVGKQNVLRATNRNLMSRRLPTSAIAAGFVPERLLLAWKRVVFTCCGLKRCGEEHRRESKVMLCNSLGLGHPRHPSTPSESSSAQQEQYLFGVLSQMTVTPDCQSDY